MLEEENKYGENAEDDNDSKDKNDNDDKVHDINDKTPLIVTLGNDDNIAKINMASLYPPIKSSRGRRRI